MMSGNGHNRLIGCKYHAHGPGWAELRLPYNEALIGDAAHAIVPFYGEGMNAGYEDCKVLNDLLNEHGDDNWPVVLAAYGKARKPNGDAIADLSLRNFVEMRDLVADHRCDLHSDAQEAAGRSHGQGSAEILHLGLCQWHQGS